MSDIPYYEDYVSLRFRDYLEAQSRAVDGVPGLTEVGAGGGLESKESLQFLCELYDLVKEDLRRVLEQRRTDREFIDQRTRACFELNRTLGKDFLDPEYETVIGQEDARGRKVVGPRNANYCRAGYGPPVAPIPKFLQGTHVTLFGPPDDAKLSINAMNAFHRKLKDEPAIISELLARCSDVPKWGADDEDSKTPLRADLVTAGENLTQCFSGDLSYVDPKSQKAYCLEDERRSRPIKRFPGLALPCSFLFYRKQPLPLHLYDFALHLFANWQNPEALAFYVPKLETEEEAAYIKKMIETAEKLVKARHPAYVVGTIRLFIVLENPRAIFLTNEIMDALHPYFAGASLGWHDYLASTARLFKEDANYRIPVKADPNIVIKYIKASHDLLNEVVGSRGGIKIGGMYGVLPMDTDLWAPSFQITLKGFFRDVVTQLKRNLSGFWVAHPDFVRLGMALVEAWKSYVKGDQAPLETLVRSLLGKEHQEEILGFIHGQDLVGLSLDNPLYPRSLLVADLKESSTIANNDPEEIRYNVFQSLQYLTDWLCGNGCVALPAQIAGVPVRVMDDLATAERSRWEVWHEIHHGRFKVEDFLRIAHEEMLFIRKDLSDSKKIVQVEWDARTEKWYPVALRLMIKLMTDAQPVEFATELLIPFTIESIRKSDDPWSAVTAIDGEKYRIPARLERFNHFFSICGSQRFASVMADSVSLDLVQAESLIRSFTLSEIIEAASFHGDIGESKRTLDEVAAREQALVLGSDDAAKKTLKDLGAQYRKKFGVKFLISAQGKSSEEILRDLNTRLGNSKEQELENARGALWEISCKRLLADSQKSLATKIEKLLAQHGVPAASIAISSREGAPIETLVFGSTRETWFELASLSKTLASCFTLEYFRKRGIPLEASVNSLLEKTASKFRLKSLDDKHPEWADAVTILNLMKHNALNMHYVNGVPANQGMPNVRELLEGNQKFGYSAVGVLHAPGSAFQYSGGGFLVLEHLLESLEKKSIQEITKPFFHELGLKNLSFEQTTQPGVTYADGHLANGNVVEGGRKMFPAFAAGAMGTSSDLQHFLNRLTKAYASLEGAGPISHDTAVRLLQGIDISSQKFMGVNLGIGVFIAEAGPNRLAVHQGANDGFRSLFVHCFAGPDLGKGFTIFCNADSNGVLFVTDVAQLILKELRLAGVDTGTFREGFNASGIPTEEVVNRAYRDLLFKSFIPDLPDPIIERGPLDPLASFNLAVGGEVLEVTNQRFARAVNLLSDHLPVFDPELYGNQGKTMDSWETVRHNPYPADRMVFKLKRPATIAFLSLSTKYHLGNQVEAVKLEGRETESGEWKPILPRTEMKGHALLRIRLEKATPVFQQIRVTVFPDGGFTRLGLHGAELPLDAQKSFRPLGEAQCEVYADAIPHSARPLTPKYRASPEVIAKNWAELPRGSECDIASAAYGGKIIRASNEHYGPATQVISPYPPLNMFDGFESARSRIAGHTEELLIQLGHESKLHRLEIDFTYFKNNNPRALSIQGQASHGGWIPLLEKTDVKAYAGLQASFPVSSPEAISQLRITVYPDGGMNRVRAYCLR